MIAIVKWQSIDVGDGLTSQSLEDELVSRANTFLAKVLPDAFTNGKLDFDKLVFHKKNNESELDFVFDIENKTTGTYLIKELEFYIDAKVETTKLNKTDKDIDIEYKLWLQDEYIGDFIFRIKVKE